MKKQNEISLFGFTEKNKKIAQEKMESGKFKTVFLCTKFGKIKQIFTISQFSPTLYEIINF
jgi:hypothetical protein